MATISLADAVHLRARIQERIREFSEARARIATIVVARGETPEPPTVTVDEYNRRISEAQADFRMLDVAMAQLNLTHTLKWDNREVPLLEALQIAKDTRQRIADLKVLGQRVKVSRARMGGYLDRGNADLLEVATYDPEVMQQQAEQLERQVMRLSRMIDRKNEEVLFDYAPATQYMAFD